MFLKDVDALLDFAVDWTDACAGVRTVADSVWRVEPDMGEAGLTVAEASHTATETGVRLGGGQAGLVYRLGNRVTFSDGTGDERSLVIRVEER